MLDETLNPRPYFRLLLLIVLLISSEWLGTPVGAHAQGETVLLIRAVYPSELAPLATDAIALFNNSHFKTKEGATLNISGASLSGINALTSLLSGDPQAHLWLAPSSSIHLAKAESANTPLRPIACAPLTSSPLGVAFRSVDGFGALNSQQGIPAAAIFAPAAASTTSPSRGLLVGSPLSTTTGVASLKAATSFALHKPFDRLSVVDIDSNIPAIVNTQRAVRSFFLSDRDALQRLVSHPAGQPLGVLTTEQQYRASKTPQQDLLTRWAPLKEPATAVEYQRCLLDRPSSPLLADDVRETITTFFSAENLKGSILAHHFEPMHTPTETQEVQSEGLKSLLSHRTELTRPAAVTFVIDTSLRVSPDQIESIRGDLKLFAQRASPESLSLGIVPTTTTVNRPVELTSDKERLSAALDALATSGTNALWDGLGTALTFTSNLRLLDRRRAVVVITSSDDAVSQLTIERVTTRARHLASQRGVELRIIGVGPSEDAFVNSRALAESVGGYFVLASLETLPRELRMVMEEVG